MGNLLKKDAFDTTIKQYWIEHNRIDKPCLFVYADFVKNVRVKETPGIGAGQRPSQAPKSNCHKLYEKEMP
ncbi:MAG: hypothetical protein A2Z03_10490 [Chloroflexi bacterium RBG_16_56_8]|nr:MAG: hypothetical protein A2Z03_10490 [Chloroflexi bacterium RBG_16_56_8]